MAYQFLHLESYSRKGKDGRGVKWVLDEAERRPGACTHVAAPAPPVVVHGLAVAELRAEHDARCEFRNVTKNGRERALRNDQHTLLTAVVSHPATMDQVRADPATASAVAAWERDTVAWLRAQWGDRLVTVLRHLDEAHPHLHAYVLPDAECAMKAKTLHPGHAAKEAAKAAAEAAGLDGKAANAEGDKAYKQALRGLQDGYWEAVGLRHGLARLGPGRRRLTRAAWQAEQAAVRAVGRAEAALADVRERGGQAVRRAVAARDTALRQAAEAKAAADAATVRAEAVRAEAERLRREASSGLRQARAEAAATVRAAEAKASRLSGVGAALGGLWTGLRGVQRKLEAEAEARVKAARREAAEKLKAAKALARADLESRYGADLSGLRERAEAAERAASAAREQAERAQQAAREREAEAKRERASRQRAEREREAFRGRWADADNRLQELERGHTRDLGLRR